MYHGNVYLNLIKQCNLKKFNKLKINKNMYIMIPFKNWYMSSTFWEKLYAEILLQKELKSMEMSSLKKIKIFKYDIYFFYNQQFK